MIVNSSFAHRQCRQGASGGSIFGGFAPFTATWLIAQTGDPLSPAYYLMATALLSIIALMVIARRGPVGGRSPAGC